jgi:hypothetical protein
MTSPRLDPTRFEFNEVCYDERHGGPWDRGSADSWYDRPRRPHYFVGDTYNSAEVTIENMTNAEIDAYHSGYDFNEKYGDKKVW